MRPEFRRTQTELRARSSLIPKHLILQLVRFCVVVNHETFIVLRALVHDLAKRIEIGKHPRILLIELTAVADNVLT